MNTEFGNRPNALAHDSAFVFNDYIALKKKKNVHIIVLRHGGDAQLHQSQSK